MSALLFLFGIAIGCIAGPVGLFLVAFFSDKHQKIKH
jgi:hypothetical protein